MDPAVVNRLSEAFQQDFIKAEIKVNDSGSATEIVVAANYQGRTELELAPEAAKELRSSGKQELSSQEVSDLLLGGECFPKGKFSLVPGQGDKKD